MEFDSSRKVVGFLLIVALVASVATFLVLNEVSDKGVMSDSYTLPSSSGEAVISLYLQGDSETRIPAEVEIGNEG